MHFDSLIIKIALVLFPIILVGGWTYASEKIFIKIHHRSQLWLTSLFGIIGAAAIYFFVSYYSEKYDLGMQNIGSAKGATIGILIGLVVSFASGGLYSLSKNRKTWYFQYFSENLGKRMIRNLGVASLEEVGFRGGMVFFLKSFWGNPSAIIGGSALFGIAHLGGRLFGQPVGLMHVIGASLAGLVLTLIYMKYGLLSSMSFHWIWNVLVRSWIKTLKVDENGALQKFEGAWTTILVFIAASLLLFLI
jgi:membrane protease YdiL (CAAX protease family)